MDLAWSGRNFVFIVCGYIWPNPYTWLFPYGEQHVLSEPESWWCEPVSRVTLLSILFSFCVSGEEVLCTHACRHGGQRLTLGTFPYHCLIRFLKECLSVNLRLTYSFRLASQKTTEIYPSSLHQLWGYRCMPLCSVFMWMIGIQTQDLMLPWQTFYPLNHCSSPSIQFSFLLRFGNWPVHNM